MQQRILLYSTILFVLFFFNCVTAGKFKGKGIEVTSDSNANRNININLGEILSDDEEDNTKADSNLSAYNNSGSLIKFNKSWLIKIGDDKAWSAENYDDTNWNLLTDSLASELALSFTNIGFVLYRNLKANLRIYRFLFYFHRR